MPNKSLWRKRSLRSAALLKEILIRNSQIRVRNLACFCPEVRYLIELGLALHLTYRCVLLFDKAVPGPSSSDANFADIWSY